MEKSKIRELWFQINAARRAALRPYFQEIGLKVGQGQPRILNSLRKYGTMTQRELADRCFVDVTTISRTVDRLVKAGLLRKRSIRPAEILSDQSDRRGQGKGGAGEGDF